MQNTNSNEKENYSKAMNLGVPMGEERDDGEGDNADEDTLSLERKLQQQTSLSKDVARTTTEEKERHKAEAGDNVDTESTSSPQEQTTPSIKNRMRFVFRNESIRFALRITLAMTATSLFVLLSSPIPEPTFIQITAGIVAWQPTNDVGSVIKKAWQRTVGTAIGGGIGLAVGAVSLTIKPAGSPQQATYLGIMTSVVNFVMVYYTCEWGFRSHYSAVLGALTAGFVTLAFFDEEGDKAWSLGVFRITNIILGGLIGSICCFIVFPESTKHLIETKIESQIKMTGTAAKEVLSMTSKHNDGEAMPSYQHIVKDADVHDVAHSAYIKAIFNIKDVRNLFTLLVYDPTFRRLDKEKQTNFVTSNRIKLGRLLRTLSTILQIDSLLRSGVLKDDVLNSELLQRVGENMSTLLDRSNSKSVLDETAYQLLKVYLPAVRNQVDVHVRRRSKRGSFTKIDDPTLSDEEVSQLFSNFDDNTSSFVDAFFGIETDMLYRHVDNLIVRCLRLHHIWPLKRL